MILEFTQLSLSLSLSLSLIVPVLLRERKCVNVAVGTWLHAPGVPPSPLTVRARANGCVDNYYYEALPVPSIA